MKSLGRRIRYSRYTPTVRRAVLYGGGLLVGLGIVWIALTGLDARRQLAQVESRVRSVKALVASGDIADARRLAADIPAMSRRAQRLTAGPAWWLAAKIPYFGAPLDVVRGTTAVGAQVGSDALPQLLQVADSIDPSRLRASGDTVRLRPLQAAAPQLTAAAHQLNRSVAELQRLPSSTWFGAVDESRTQLADQLGAVRGYVDAAARVCSALPDMLGRARPMRYFLGLQNEAEMRGTGGLPGAFAIAVADHGTIRFTHFGSDSEFSANENHGELLDTGLHFGADYDTLYGSSDPTHSFLDSNVSPNFPYAAQIWAAMWQQRTGEHIDGVLALDPTVLRYFLLATGPTVLPDHRVLTAQNVVSLTERDEYALFPDNAQRKAFLVSVLRAAAHRITSGAGQPLKLVQAASLSAQEQRLLAWSRDPRIEHLLEQTNFAGAIPPGDRPLSAAILNNTAAGKLDYYLHRSVSYSRTGCGARRDVSVTISLTDEAPASGLPPYVTTRLDPNPPPDAKPGDSRVLLDYYATGGALLESATINGKPGAASAFTDLGHAVFRIDVELPRATTQTIVLHLNEPAGTGAVQIWRQPGVNPIHVMEFDQTCG